MKKLTEAMKAAILADSKRERRTVEQDQAWRAFLNKPFREKRAPEAEPEAKRIWPH